jgi:hypothetical protein
VSFVQASSLGIASKKLAGIERFLPGLSKRIRAIHRQLSTIFRHFRLGEQSQCPITAMVQCSDSEIGQLRPVARLSAR